MAIVERSPTTIDAANGAPELERLQAHVRKLEDECSRLKQALAKAESERSAYHQLYLEQARATREFENLDVETLERMSAGPVELLK